MYNISLYRIVLCCVMLCRAVLLYCTVLCRVILCWAVRCTTVCAMLCFAVLCCAVLCCIVLCCAETDFLCNLAHTIVFLQHFYKPFQRKMNILPRIMITNYKFDSHRPIWSNINVSYHHQCEKELKAVLRTFEWRSIDQRKN